MSLHRLLGDRRGGAGLIAAGAMPLLIGAAAFAVDVGAMQLDARRLQGLADAAALAAASDPSHAQAKAEASVAAAGWQRQIDVRTTAGSYAQDSSVAAANRFTAGSGNPDAARVVLETESPSFFARIFGRRSVTVSRRATARQQQFAAFAIGSRLASFDGGVLNGFLSALTGSNVSLSVMDYQALASADVDLFGYLSALRTGARLNALTFDDVLKSQVSTPAALGALADVLAADGQARAAAAVRAIGNASGGGSISLSTLIDAGPFARQSAGGAGVAQIDSLAFATAILQLANGTRQVAFDLGAGVPGIASTRVSIAIGERMQQSPWIAISDRGTPVIRTAQARVYIRARLLPSALPGIGGLASIDLPLFVELASAEGRLAAIDCASVATRGVTLEGRTDVGRVAIGTIDESRLADFSTSLDPTTATLVDTPLIDVKGSSRISIGAAEPWRALRFSDAEIAGGVRKTIESTRPVAGVATSLLQQASLDAYLLGAKLPAGLLIQAVGGVLQGVAPALDPLLMAATGTIGLGLGEADLSVTGMRCGQAVLVA